MDVTEQDTHAVCHLAPICIFNTNLVGKEASPTTASSAEAVGVGVGATSREVEAASVAALVARLLLEDNVPHAKIAIACLYPSQAEAIRRQLRKHRIQPNAHHLPPPPPLPLPPPPPPPPPSTPPRATDGAVLPAPAARLTKGGKEGKEGGRQRLRLPSPLSSLPLSSLSGVSGVSPSVSSQVNSRAVSLGSTKRHDDLPLDSLAHPGQVAQERHEVGHEMCLLMPRVYCLGSVGGEKEMELQREVYDVFICCVTPCIPYAVAVDAVDGVMSMSIPALMGTAEAAADEAAAADVLAHAALTARAGM
eukprot:CAMPEP_0179436176 /NCGR_PEP_ID=MMETSP0799-20121207/20176_1 /TAXON_ID=46947 /ORGANISM="Geminigera cryophila, Strain CCMP2564" /LENGTH=305 /DNA_ID=CAMNT_0021216065 /DNA_START=144 /DNA_END=1062 /DNA_ORIENTATION=-